LVEPGLDPAQATAHARSWDRLVAIAVALPGGQCQRLRYGELGQFLFGERPGLLDELAVRQLPDDAHLDAVLEQVQVLALQAEADALGHDVRDDRYREDGYPGDLGGRVELHVEMVGEDV